MLMDEEVVIFDYDARRPETGIDFADRMAKTLALYAKAIAGYSGFSWYVPRTCICLRNARLRPHPTCERCLLMDPLPPAADEQKWTMYEFDANEAGTGVFTRDGLVLEGHWNEDFKADFIRSIKT